jgi:hypothetical protein
VKTTFGPARISVVEVDRPMDVFRIVRSDVPEDPVLLNSLRSHYELGEEPRKVERSSTVLHMGISTYFAAGVAHGTAKRFPVIGEFVARLTLRPGQGFGFVHTGHRLHLTVWGDPIKLHEAVADIKPVQT